MSPILDSIGSAKGYGWGSFSLGGSFESIARVAVGAGGSSTITFSSIPSTYKHLQLRILGYASSADGKINFNGDTTNTNYYRHSLYGDGASASVDALNIPYIDAGGTSTTYPAVYVIDILDYASTNKYKTVRNFWGYDYNGSGRTGLVSILWSNTNAINTISFTNRAWSEGSSFALYGIKGA